MPKCTPAEIDGHRPVVPATPMEALASRVLRYQREAALAPQRVCAEGVVRNGSKDGHIPTQLVAERISERGGRVWMLKADLRAPSVASTCFHDKAVPGHGIPPEWMVVPGTSVPIHKWCKQGEG